MIVNPDTLPAAAREILGAGVAQPVLKVLGMGGGGCNAVARMMELQMRGIDFIAANTDAQVLKDSPAPTRILLGPNVTRGMGAGGDPERGHDAAEESRSQIAAALAGADMVFLTAGMGGGTGTGSIPVAAQIAQAQGAVTVAIVTTPFGFEMGRRQKNAVDGINRLRDHTHTLISIPNDKLLTVAPRNLPLEMAFRMADDVLRQAVQGITELITEPGLINVDFAHIRRLITLGGGSLLSMGQAKGEGKAAAALNQALHHPLLDDVDIHNAAGVIANFTGGSDLSLFEVQEALDSLQEGTGPQTEVIFGVIQDERLEGRAQVILMVTGLGGHTLEEAIPGFRRPESRFEKRIENRVDPRTVLVEAEVGPPAVEAPARPALPLNPGPVGRDLPPFFRFRTQGGVTR